MVHKLMLFIACLIFSMLSVADVYKWVDKNGEVHYQDHPRGSKSEGITIDEHASSVKSDKNKEPDPDRLVREMEKARKQREKQRHKKLVQQQKQDEKCIKLRSRQRKAQARLDKNYSEFSNDRPASYARQKAELEDRKKYLDKYCN